LVILAAHVVSGGEAPVAPMLVSSSVQWCARLDETAGRRFGKDRVRLAVAFSFYCSFCCSPASRPLHFCRPAYRPARNQGDLAGMVGVSAMAVQNALVQISLKGAPSTRHDDQHPRFMMDVGEVIFGREPVDIAKARSRAMHTWPAIVGFAVGCASGRHARRQSA